MTLLHLHKMLQTPFGRIINFILIIAIFNLSSCTTYKAADTNLVELRATEQVTANLDVYKFFVHDTYNSYELSNPVFNADGSLSGTVKLTTYQTPDSTWSKKERKAYWKEHKYDVNIFTETVLSVLRADIASTTPMGTETITITPTMIDKMTITSIDAERQASDAGIIVFGVLGLIVVAVLVILLFNAADGGGGDGGSGSGSGSD